MNPFRIPLPLIAILVTSNISFAGEAWYIEMPLTHGQALLDRFQKSRNDKYLEALSKLPDLIKSGIIKEIEKFKDESSSRFLAEGGAHFPATTVNVRDKKMTIGSEYRSSPGKLTRFFTLKFSPNQHKIRNLNVSLHGLRGSDWSPTFMLVTEQTCRILFERDSKATEKFTSPNHQVNIETLSSQKTNHTFSWLTPSIPGDDNLKISLFYGGEFFLKKHKAWAHWGYNLSVSPGKNEKMAFDIIENQRSESAYDASKYFTAKTEKSGRNRSHFSFDIKGLEEKSPSRSTGTSTKLVFTIQKFRK